MFVFDQGEKNVNLLVGRKKIIWLGRKTIPPPPPGIKCLAPNLNMIAFLTFINIGFNVRIDLTVRYSIIFLVRRVHYLGRCLMIFLNDNYN